MAVFELHAGGRIDTVTPRELHHELLAQDARLKADLSGVKWGEIFVPSGQIAGAQTYTTSLASQVPGAGFIWAIMGVGLELSASSQVRVYKRAPVFAGPGTITPSGNGRLVTTLASFVTPSSQFSKGQLTLRQGEQLTLVMVTAGSILSVYVAYIEVPAEQQGKLWL
jgi:hypothetical protein